MFYEANSFDNFSNLSRFFQRLESLIYQSQNNNWEESVISVHENL